MLLFLYNFRYVLNGLKLIFLVVVTSIIHLINTIFGLINFKKTYLRGKKMRLRILRGFKSYKKIALAPFWIIYILKTINYTQLKRFKFRRNFIIRGAFWLDKSMFFVVLKHVYIALRRLGADNDMYKHRKNEVNFFNFKHIYNRPASKTWDLEYWRKSEWDFADLTFFSRTLEDYYEFDYGTAKNSWNILWYKKPFDLWSELYGSDEEDLLEIARPLMYDNYKEHLFYNHISLFEEF